MPDPALVKAKRENQRELLAIEGVYEVAIGAGEIVLYAYPGSHIENVPAVIDNWPVSIEYAAEPTPDSDNGWGLPHAEMHGTDWSDRGEYLRPVPVGADWGCGVAFIVTDGEDFYTTTAGHCVDIDNPDTRVKEQGGERVASLVREPLPNDLDLALLDIEAPFSTEALGVNSWLEGPPTSVEVGDEVLLLGARSGMKTSTVKTVGGLKADGAVHGVRTTEDVSQGGDSGSPWIMKDEQGRWRPAGWHVASGGGSSIFQEVTDVNTVLENHGKPTLEVVTGNALVTESDIPVRPNERPTAVIDTSHDGAVVTFDGSRSSDPDGEITDYVWDINGLRETGQTVTHGFASEGIYNVTLTVSDDDGATGSTTDQVEVWVDGPSPKMGVTKNGLKVALNAGGTTSEVPIEEYRWTLDGSTQLFGEFVTHTFETAGEHEIELRVRDEFGQFASVSQTVTLTDPSEPEPEPEPEPGDGLDEFELARNVGLGVAGAYVVYKVLGGL